LRGRAGEGGGGRGGRGGEVAGGGVLGRAVAEVKGFKGSCGPQTRKSRYWN
jgi:hypothetical protein